MKQRKIFVWILIVLCLLAILFFALAQGERVQAKTVGELQGENTEKMRRMLEDYSRQVDVTLEQMEREMVRRETLENYEKSREFDSFSGDIRDEINGIRDVITRLENTSLEDADFEFYQQEIARKLLELQEKYRSLEEKDGDREELRRQLRLLQQDLESFQADYGNASEKVKRAILHLENEIGDREETIYGEYEGNIWSALEELEQWLEQSDSHSGDLQIQLEELRRETEQLFENLEMGMDEVKEQVRTKMDATAFYAYKDSVDISMAALEAAVEEVEGLLQNEGNLRMEEDQRLGEQLAELTENWNRFCNVGGVSLTDIQIAIRAMQDTIGSHDISRMGDGTVSGAITYLYKEMGDCKIRYDSDRGHFYAEYFGGEDEISRQLDYVSQGGM
ncbi:MAG: hypothetical protein PUF45_05590 [Lachnospiraceae bacterium]|nr:hypothetical protein [Lachnospiraceae bacterium]